MNVVRVKDGVQFTVIAPGGFRILAAIDLTCSTVGMDLTITSACDGEHSGPADPHHSGNAYDVRSHDLEDEQKQTVLLHLQQILGNRFFAFLENPGGPDEHFHIQVAKGTTYP